jgi:hypothetical protein
VNNIKGAIFGGFDVSTGFYDISGTQLPPQCDTAKAARASRGPVQHPYQHRVGPMSLIPLPQNYNVGPHLGLAYSLNQKTVIRGGYGLVYDEFAGFLQDTANHVGNWPDAQTVFQSLNGTLGQPLRMSRICRI